MGSSPTRLQPSLSPLEWLLPGACLAGSSLAQTCEGSQVGLAGGRVTDDSTRWPCCFGLVFLLFQQMKKGRGG